MALLSVKPHFSRFLEARPGRLHFAAHSHHPWPDVSFEAQQRAWLDAAELVDLKWERIFGEVIPQAQRHIARLLSLPDPATVAFAPNTHEFVMRLHSCLPRREARILTTDSEFHSFARQALRWETAGLARVTRVATEPFADFPARLRAAIGEGGYDLIYLSQVFFNSGYVVEDLAALVNAVTDDRTMIVIDGYHAFMAMPVDLSAIAGRAFYLAGGYKYAMAGEGACFMHCPPGRALRPPDTGWYAEFGALDRHRDGGDVAYGEDGSRFLGATFDPSGLYRFNAVQRWAQSEGVDPATVRGHVMALQEQFMRGAHGAPYDDPQMNMRGAHGAPYAEPQVKLNGGNFLCFRTPLAETLSRKWLAEGVVTDYRGDRLRIGFGVYQDPEDVAALLRRICR